MNPQLVRKHEVVHIIPPVVFEPLIVGLVRRVGLAFEAGAENFLDDEVLVSLDATLTDLDVGLGSVAGSSAHLTISIGMMNGCCCVV
ncbi:hypothetical protein WAI453_004962 [Rhynchosporium graminicola]